MYSVSINFVNHRNCPCVPKYREKPYSVHNKISRECTTLITNAGSSPRVRHTDERSLCPATRVPLANGASFHERLHRYIRIHTGRKHRVERSRERSLGEDRTRTEIIDERGGCKKPGSHGLSDAASGIRDAPPGLPPAGLSAPGIPADAPAGLSADATPGISPAGLSSATVRSRSFSKLSALFRSPRRVSPNLAADLPVPFALSQDDAAAPAAAATG